MICVICNVNEVNDMYEDGTTYTDLVACFNCRIREIPKHIPQKQYTRYWLTFSKLWKERNHKVCNM